MNAMQEHVDKLAQADKLAIELSCIRSKRYSTPASINDKQLIELETRKAIELKELLPLVNTGSLDSRQKRSYSACSSLIE